MITSNLSIDWENLKPKTTDRDKWFPSYKREPKKCLIKNKVKIISSTVRDKVKVISSRKLPPRTNHSVFIKPALKRSRDLSQQWVFHQKLASKRDPASEIDIRNQIKLPNILRLCPNADCLLLQAILPNFRETERDLWLLPDWWQVKDRDRQVANSSTTRALCRVRWPQTTRKF